MITTTWALARSKMSVCVNGTFIPFEKAPDTMQRFVRPALFSTGCKSWELRTFGTAFLCSYRGRSQAILTRHQTGDGIEKPSPEKFVTLANVGDKTLAIPPSHIYTPSIYELNCQSLRDLCIFDYGDQSHKQRIRTLDISTMFWSDSEGLQTDYSFLIGYPTASFDAETNNDGEYTKFVTKWIRQDLEEAHPQVLDLENRNIFVKHSSSTRISIDPDGLSGSPVFSIVNDRSHDRYLRFDGIITNANKDRFAIYPSVYIRQFMDKIIDGD